MEKYTKDYRLPIIDRNAFIYKRVMNKWFINFAPIEGFWNDVAVARARYAEYGSRQFGTEFEETFRSQFGYKDKKTAKLGEYDMVRLIEEAGKTYIDGGFNIPEAEEG